jgi:hypothetical protein
VGSGIGGVWREVVVVVFGAGSKFVCGRVGVEVCISISILIIKNRGDL